jgi:hypothetical protein
MSINLPLREIAYARSGDKGANANIGVIAYTENGYQFLSEILTAESVLDFFSSLTPFEVIRYELPNLLALNFVLKGILREGGSRSLRMDSQGKALGQALLEMKVPIPEDLLREKR